MIRFSNWLLLCAVLAALLFAAPSSAVATSILNLDSLINGDRLEVGGTQPSPFVEISSPDGLGAAIFDSDPLGPNAGGSDADLLVDLGNLLIIQNPNFPSLDIDNRFVEPNDYQNGGTIVFDWANPVTMMSIDLVDINGNANVTVALIDTEGDMRVYAVPAEWTGDITHGAPGFGTLDLTTLASQPGPNAGMATASEDPGFDSTAVARMTIDFRGSGATNNIAFVPEPTAAAFGLLGMSGAWLLARRRLA